MGGKRWSFLVSPRQWRPHPASPWIDEGPLTFYWGEGRPLFFWSSHACQRGNHSSHLLCEHEGGSTQYMDSSLLTKRKKNGRNREREKNRKEKRTQTQQRTHNKVQPSNRTLLYINLTRTQNFFFPKLTQSYTSHQHFHSQLAASWVPDDETTTSQPPSFEKNAHSKLTEKNTCSTKEQNAPYKDTDRQTDRQTDRRTQRQTTWYYGELAKHLTGHSTDSYTASRPADINQYIRVVWGGRQRYGVQYIKWEREGEWGARQNSWTTINIWQDASRHVGMTFYTGLATARILKVGTIYIVHELLADGTDLLWKGGTEHHHLLRVWCSSEHFLYITTHVCRNDNNDMQSVIIKDNRCFLSLAIYTCSYMLL